MAATVRSWRTGVTPCAIVRKLHPRVQIELPYSGDVKWLKENGLRLGDLRGARNQHYLQLWRPAA
jgi:hypothetical protein